MSGAESDLSELKIQLVGGNDLVQMIEPAGRGGRATPGLAALITDQTAQSVHIDHLPVEHLSDMQAAIADAGVPEQGVVIASLGAAFAEATARHDINDVEEWYLATAGDLVAEIRKGGAHVLVANASTYDPEHVTTFDCDAAEAPALVLHRLNLALIQLSVLDGISIIDADRIIAELAGETVVDGLLSYREPAVNALCAEIVRVLAEYRFFDSGHLVPQSGRRKD